MGPWLGIVDGILYIIRTCGAWRMMPNDLPHWKTCYHYFRLCAKFGHSPALEIQHAHLRRAQKLPRDTDMAVADIASASDYGSSEYMISIFNKMIKLKPQTDRTRARSLLVR